MEIAITGGVIAGLALALNLQQRGLSCRVYEAVPEVKAIGVEELTGDRPFGNLDDFISQEELRALSDQYKRIAGYSVEALATTAPPSAG